MFCEGLAAKWVASMARFALCTLDCIFLYFHDLTFESTGLGGEGGRGEMSTSNSFVNTGGMFCSRRWIYDWTVHLETLGRI